MISTIQKANAIHTGKKDGKTGDVKKLSVFLQNVTLPSALYIKNFVMKQQETGSWKMGKKAVCPQKICLLITSLHQQDPRKTQLDCQPT
jgi:hypothetical protein